MVGETERSRPMLKTKKILTAAIAAATLAGGIAAAGEASAQSRYRRDRDHTGAAITAGIAGLALGAALSSGGGYYDRGYYGRGYYDRGYYGRPYYAPPRYYGGRGYYGPRGYARTCYHWRYDRWGRAFQVPGRC
jgi:hypothetical protein